MIYFAYGSNMDKQRLVDRGIFPIETCTGILKNYRLVFNKISKKDPSYGFANIIPEWGSVVEGVLYDLNSDDILKLDKFEGFPNHYQKIILGGVHPIEFKEKHPDHNGTHFVGRDPITYIATLQYTSQNPLLITEQYASYLIKGSQNLSDEYRHNLLEYPQLKLHEKK